MDSKRRLPLWMMGQNPQAKDLNNNNNSNYNNDGDDNNSQIKQLDDNGKLIKARRRPRSDTSEKNSKRKLSGDEEAEKSLSSSVSLLVRCEERKKRGKRKLNVGEDDCNDGNGEMTMEKKKGRGKKRREVKVSKSRIDGDDKEENRDCMGISDGDDDLTVEDLMSIAEEYVKEDKEVGQKRSSLKDDLSMDDLMSIAKEYVEEDTDIRGERKIQDVAVSGSSFGAGEYNNTVSKKQEDRSCFSNENVTNEETVAKSTMSGDPTQDMLSLFLGPLLKKPQDEEKKFNVITRDTSLLYQVQKQKPSVAPKEEAVPLTKKKSSLKEKVALFLD